MRVSNILAMFVAKPRPRNPLHQAHMSAGQTLHLYRSA